MPFTLCFATLCGLLLLFISVAQASLLSPFLSLDHAAKRAVDPTSCPTGYKNCANIGAPGLCCGLSAVCAADQAGHVACCPSGAVCTGSISSIITGGVIASGGSAVLTTTPASQPLSASAASSTPQTTTTAGNGLIIASDHSTTNQSPTTTGSGAASAAAATTAQGFILVGSSTAATLGSNAVRNAQTPLIAQLIISILALLPF